MTEARSKAGRSDPRRQPREADLILLVLGCLLLFGLPLGCGIVALRSSTNPGIDVDFSLPGRGTLYVNGRRVGPVPRGYGLGTVESWLRGFESDSWPDPSAVRSSYERDTNAGHLRIVVAPSARNAGEFDYFYQREDVRGVMQLTVVDTDGRLLEPHCIGCIQWPSNKSETLLFMFR